MKILRAANLGSNFTDYYKKECINSPYSFYNIEFVNPITVSAHKMFKHALKKLAATCFVIACTKFSQQVVGMVCMKFSKYR